MCGGGGDDKEGRREGRKEGRRKERERKGKEGGEERRRGKEGGEEGRRGGKEGGKEKRRGGEEGRRDKEGGGREGGEGRGGNAAASSRVGRFPVAPILPLSRPRLHRCPRPRSGGSQSWRGRSPQSSEGSQMSPPPPHLPRSPRLSVGQGARGVGKVLSLVTRAGQLCQSR